MNALIPSIVHRGLSLVLFALPLALIGVHAALAAWGAARAEFPQRARFIAPLAVAGFLALWLALAMVLGDPLNFPLADNNVRRLLSLLVGFGPMILAAVLLVASRSISALYGAMPPEWLIRVQVYRVTGFIFLYPLLYHGVVPAGFALPAALGDILTGIMAPFIGSAVRTKRIHAFEWAVGWNIFGILDLIVAPAAAVLSGAQVLALYPVSLIPLFIGPPLGILTHIYSLRNLRIVRRKELTNGPGVDLAPIRVSAKD
jgi:hypothetical protein